jgi:hypothetical protein
MFRHVFRDNRQGTSFPYRSAATMVLPFSVTERTGRFSGVRHKNDQESTLADPGLACLTAFLTCMP